MKNRSEPILYGTLILILSLIPVYTILINGLPYLNYPRHISFFKHESPFFNPWQYRILSPYLTEGFHRLLKGISLGSLTDSPASYLHSFKYFFILQSVLINLSLWKLYKYFTPNRPLRLAGLIILTSALAFSGLEADIFNFNIYFDVLFYTWGALLIYSGKNKLWFLPLTFFSALNRETSLLLPLLLLLDRPEAGLKKSVLNQLKLITGCYLIFSLVFISIRVYYGYQPPAPIGMEVGWPMLRFNLTDPQTVFWLFSMVSVLPVFVLFHLQKSDPRLRMLFWLLVPAWFAVHFWLVWAREIRLFTVPLAVVFIPVLLDIIQRSFAKTSET